MIDLGKYDDSRRPEPVVEYSSKLVAPPEERKDPHNHSLDYGAKRSSYKPEFAVKFKQEKPGSGMKRGGMRTMKKYEPVNYNEMEDAKDYTEPERPIAMYSEKMNKNSYDKPEPVMGGDVNFTLEGGARRDPLVKIPFNDTLLHDYCLMLDKENNRDVNIFAIQSLAPLIADCANNIVNDAEKFMA